VSCKGDNWRSFTIDLSHIPLLDGGIEILVDRERLVLSRETAKDWGAPVKGRLKAPFKFETFSRVEDRKTVMTLTRCSFYFSFSENKVCGICFRVNFVGNCGLFRTDSLLVAVSNDWR